MLSGRDRKARGCLLDRGGRSRYIRSSFGFFLEPRTGGAMPLRDDGFAVLLPETGAEEAVVFAERLRADLERLEVDYGGHTIRFSCSFGVASRGEDIAVLDTLLMRADEALYRAKNQGRNRRTSSMNRS